MMPPDRLPIWTLLLEALGIAEVAFVLALLLCGFLVKFASPAA